MLRIVCDTNVFVSAVLYPDGVASQVLEYIIKKEVQCFIGDAIMEETERVLSYPRLKQLFRHSENSNNKEYIRLLQSICSTVSKIPIIQVVRDPSDDIILGCALKAKEDYLITRNKDLLVIQKYHKTNIISPETFLSILRRSGKQS